MSILNNILSQDMIQRLGWTLVHSFWQIAIVALVLVILLKVFRKSSANTRYIIACMSLGIIFLLPVATVLMSRAPSLEVTTAEYYAVEAVAAETAELPSGELSIVYKAGRKANLQSRAVVFWQRQVVSVIDSIVPNMVLVWIIGVFGFSIWHLGGWAQLQRLRYRMVKQVDASLHNKLEDLSKLLHVRHAVQLMKSSLVQVPTVVGWVWPVILLPASTLTGLTAKQLDAILVHELAHIRRYDYLVNILQTMVEIVGFYHPCVWWVSYKIRVEREHCCDDLAINVVGDRFVYASALVSLEEVRHRQYRLTVAANGGSLLCRIQRLLSKDSTEGRVAGWIPSAVSLLLMVLVIAPLAFALTPSSTLETKTNEIVFHQQASDRNADPLAYSEEIAEAARNLFGKIRDADYEAYLSGESWESFPTAGIYDSERWDDIFVQWIVKTFINNAIETIELGEVFMFKERVLFFEKRGFAAVPYKVTLSDGTVLEGNLPFEYRVENEHGRWVGLGGIDWHLRPEYDGTRFGEINNLRAYKVNPSAINLTDGEDLSTPEAAYYTINRSLAVGDYSILQRASIKEISELRAELYGDEKEKKHVDPEWSQVLLNSRVIEVWLFEDNWARVIAELPQEFTSKPLEKPFEAHGFRLVDGRWLNIGKSRFATIYETRARVSENLSK